MDTYLTEPFPSRHERTPHSDTRESVEGSIQAKLELCLAQTISTDRHTMHIITDSCTSKTEKAILDIGSSLSVAACTTLHSTTTRPASSRHASVAFGDQVIQSSEEDNGEDVSLASRPTRTPRQPSVKTSVDCSCHIPDTGEDLRQLQKG